MTFKPLERRGLSQHQAADVAPASRAVRGAGAAGGRRLGKIDHRTDDLALLHGVEGIIDLVDLNSSGDHALEIELSCFPEPKQFRHEGSDIRTAIH